MADFQDSLDRQKSLQLEKSSEVKKIIGLILISVAVLSAIAFLASNFYNSYNKNKNNNNDDDFATKPASESNSLVRKSGSLDLFQELYSDYIDKYERDLNSLRKTPKYGMESEEVIKGVKNALNYSMRGDNNYAIEKMHKAIKIAKQLIAENKKDLDVSSEKLKYLYNKIMYQEFLDEIDFLYANNQDSELYNVWSAKIKELEKIYKLNRDFLKFKSENNYISQLATIDRILKLDPNLKDFKEKRKKIKEAVDSIRFKKLISRIDSDLSRRLPKSALTKLNNARAIYPNAPEIEERNYQIKNMIKSLEIERLSVRIQNLILQDDWVPQLSLYKELLGLAPDNEGFNSGFDLAMGISKSIDISVKLNKEPLRLSDQNVSDYTKGFLSDAKVLIKQSPKLNKLISELEKNYLLANKKIKIDLISDSKTTIEVKRVGYLSPFYERQLELTPGVYTFKLVRKGFRQKIIEITIPLNGITSKQRLICDERI